MKLIDKLLIVAFIIFAVLTVWAIVRNRDRAEAPTIQPVEETVPFYPDLSGKGA